MVGLIIIALLCLVSFIKASENFNSFGEETSTSILSTTNERQIQANSADGQFLAVRSFPPVPKPDPSTEQPGSSFIIEHGSSDEEESNNLIKQIPDSFTVNETTGTYESYEDDSNLTSADVMKKRSVLYRLLSDIYTLFDTFDFDGFRDFLREMSDALKHQSLRYHLVDNLVKRSIKSKNKSTRESLARFIEMIDVACVTRTVGHLEHDTFAEFESNIRNYRKKLSEVIKTTLYTFLKNETTRLFPLNEAFSANDYETAKRILEGSNQRIWMSMDDFLFLLGRPSVEARYGFMKWVITNGHFNVHEKYGQAQVTPLMQAAMHMHDSNDIVKAILDEAPDTATETDKNGQNAVYYAKKNSWIPKKSRKLLVKMLKLENPATETL